MFLFIDAAHSGSTDLGPMALLAPPHRSGLLNHPSRCVQRGGQLKRHATSPQLEVRRSVRPKRRRIPTAERRPITGTFFDDGSRHVVPGQDYYGIGHVVIAGSAGHIVGEAILYRVTEGGDSWSSDFTKIDTCT